MKILDPITITDSILISSSVSEDDYPIWAPSTNYVMGDKRIRTETHRIYECVSDHLSTSVPPEDLTGGGTPLWADIAPTNRWAMFDNVIGTYTTATGEILVELAPGIIGGFNGMEFEGELLEVTMLDDAGGTEIYSFSKSLDGTQFFSVVEFLLAEFVQIPLVSLTDLPDMFYNCRVIVRISGTSSVKCGLCQVGVIHDIGNFDYGLSLRNEDYSVKTVTSQGYTTLIPGLDRKLMEGNLIVPFEKFNQVERLLTSLKKRPATYIGADYTGYEPFTVFGFLKDFRPVLPKYENLICAIEIEGLI